MFNSLKIYFYFYIVTLPFTLFLTQIIEFDIEKPFDFLLINIFAGLSVFIYYKKIKPLFNEEKAKSKINLLLLLIASLIILLLFHISSELTTVYSEISDIEQKVSDMEHDISEIKNDTVDIHNKLFY
jgi:cell division protein FtsL